MPKYDISKLLYSRSESDRLINSLDVAEDRIAVMKAARTEVRNAIKTAFTAAKTNHQYLARMSPEEKTAFLGIEPRFWPQGSFAYGTQNVPAHVPPQQIDIDDGVYLPIEALRERPIVFKEIFFDIVDTTLRNLAAAEGWKFIGHKDTCTRLEIDPEVHLDVPLYAIPIARFEKLQKAMGRVSLNRAALEIVDDFDLRRILSEEEVYLALRSSPHWQRSDPIRIQEWFEHEQRVFKDIFTRVCRYMKAWRDNVWTSGGPSSITLMICVWETFRDSERQFNTDSEALLAVCRQLPGRLKTGVFNPVHSEEIVFPRNLDNEELKAMIAQVEAFSSQVCGAIESGSSAIEVVQILTIIWGPRMPFRADWVTSASAAATAIVSSTPSKVQPRPEVGTMRSGYRSA